MVDAGGHEVFFKSLIQRSRENPCIAIAQQAAVRQGIQLEERDDTRVYCNRSAGKLSQSGGRRWHINNTWNTLSSADALVITQEKSFAPNNWATAGSPE